MKLAREFEMSDVVHYAVMALLMFLIFCCVARQRRYWREIHTNRPSGTVRAGYVFASVTLAFSFIYAAIVGTDESWALLFSIVPMAILFCLKITFSPAILAFVLGSCTVQFHLHGNFPFFEIWRGVATVITWRFPEEVRIGYALLTFLWMIGALLFGGGRAESVEEGLESAADTVGVLGH